MPSLPRRSIPVRRIWGGLAGVAVVFALSLGTLSAWQLGRYGPPVVGVYQGSFTAEVIDCGRDPGTLWQSWTCELDYSQGQNPPATMKSVDKVSGQITVDIFARTKLGPRAEAMAVAQGAPRSTADWMPTDLLLAGWVALIIFVPLGLAIGGGVRRTQPDQPSPFDEVASTWDDDPSKLKRAAAVASAIIERTSPGGNWLDYGAGTGTLGLALLDHADQVVLADSSQGMLSAARAKIAASGLQGRVSVLDLDLASQDAEAASFDGVATLLALHHIDNAGEVVGKMATALRPGGWLAVADLDAEDGSFHLGGHGIVPAHHGFQRTQVAEWFAAAGLVEIDLSTPWIMQKQDRDYSVFLVVGRKPSG